MDAYRVLQVDPAAEPEIIEAAYWRLARKYHPDVYRGRDATTRMREINAAHAIIGDARERQQHDRERKAARERRRITRESTASFAPRATDEHRGRIAKDRRTTPVAASPANPGIPDRPTSPLRKFGTTRPPMRIGLFGVAIAIGLAALVASFFVPEERRADNREPGTVVVVESRAAPSPTAITYTRRDTRGQSDSPPPLPTFPSSAGDAAGAGAVDWFRRLIGRPQSEARIAGPRTPERPTVDPIIGR